MIPAIILFACPSTPRYPQAANEMRLYYYGYKMKLEIESFGHTGSATLPGLEVYDLDLNSLITSIESGKE